MLHSFKDFTCGEICFKFLKKNHNCPQNNQNCRNNVQNLTNLGFLLCKSDKLIQSLKSLPH